MCWLLWLFEIVQVLFIVIYFKFIPIYPVFLYYEFIFCTTNLKIVYLVFTFCFLLPKIIFINFTFSILVKGQYKLFYCISNKGLHNFLDLNPDSYLIFFLFLQSFPKINNLFNICVFFYLRLFRNRNLAWFLAFLFT